MLGSIEITILVEEGYRIVFEAGNYPTKRARFVQDRFRKFWEGSGVPIRSSFKNLVRSAKTIAPVDDY